jgi:hypothetical protein
LALLGGGWPILPFSMCPRVSTTSNQSIFLMVLFAFAIAVEIASQCSFRMNQQVIPPCKHDLSSALTFRLSGCHVRKKTNQTTAIATITRAKLQTRTLRTVGPRSAPRASIGVSTIVSPFFCALLVSNEIKRSTPRSDSAVLHASPWDLARSGNRGE